MFENYTIINHNKTPQLISYRVKQNVEFWCFMYIYTNLGSYKKKKEKKKHEYSIDHMYEKKFVIYINQ